MRLEIEHITQYLYEEPVFAEPHYLHFYPQQRPYLKVSNFEVSVDPKPDGMAERIDAENNPQIQCWFDQPIDQLVIKSKLNIETTAFNPFNFFIDQKSITNGLLAKPAILRPYLDLRHPLGKPIKVWADSLKNEAGEDPMTFITYLNTEISTHWDHAPRYTEDLMTPDECFAKKTGSCRDLSWMLIETLRHYEIPARFVSGYAYNPELGAGHELHAWVETWLPGAGWISVDPSAGLFTSEAYIPVTTSYNPQMTVPVVGHYRGKSTSTLKTEVTIKNLG